MTRHGLKVALKHAESLPSFSSLEEAEKFLFGLRDTLCELLEHLAEQSDVRLDYSPESLKSLEKWYFDLCACEGFGALGVTLEDFERCMGFYRGRVYTKNHPEFDWIVKESPFHPGKFEIGVSAPGFTLMIGRVAHLQELKHNVRRESMFREYRKWTTPAKASKQPIKGHRRNKPCPHCGEPLRTNQAQQCFDCGASWRTQTPSNVLD